MTDLPSVQDEILDKNTTEERKLLLLDVLTKAGNLVNKCVINEIGKLKIEVTRGSITIVPR